jgi:hypothetical protein
MAKSELKTKVTKASVEEFLETVADEAVREDSRQIAEIMSRLTDSPAVMWGPAMVGFGTYHYKYESGREGDWMLVGFSPRKANLTLYIVDGFEKYDDLMSKLGKHKTGKSCLYIKSLKDIDLAVLEELITESVESLRKKYN